MLTNINNLKVGDICAGANTGTLYLVLSLYPQCAWSFDQKRKMYGFTLHNLKKIC